MFVVLALYRLYRVQAVEYPRPKSTGSTNGVSANFWWHLISSRGKKVPCYTNSYVLLACGVLSRATSSDRDIHPTSETRHLRTSQNDLIDALECLASLAIMSGMDMEQKIRYANDQQFALGPSIRQRQIVLCLLIDVCHIRSAHDPFGSIIDVFTHTPFQATNPNVSYLATNKLRWLLVELDECLVSSRNPRKTGNSARRLCVHVHFSKHAINCCGILLRVGAR